jgi:type IV pilus assembly protein PilO
MAAVLFPIVVFLAAFIGGGFLLVKPKADEAYELEVSLDRLKTDYVRKKRQAENLDAFRAQLAEIERLAARVRSALPDRFDRDFTPVREAARRRGVRMEEARLAPEQVREFFARLPLRIKVTGRYHDLGAFAADLERAAGSLVLQDLRLYPAPRPGQVTMEANVTAFRYRTEQEAAKGTKP